MGERRTILIVGAGIAGLTAALALAAKGFPVVVAERADKLSEIGAGIQIAPNAGRILADLNLDRRLAAAATEPRSIDVFSGGSGSRLASVPTARFRDAYRCPYWVIRRSDLQSILATATERAGVQLILGAVLDEIAPETGGLAVRVRTAAGVDVVHATAIIGADGVWSTTRTHIAATAYPAATGRTAWRAIVDGDRARELVALDRVGLWLGHDAHLVHYPIARGSAVNVVAIVEEPWQAESWGSPADGAALSARWFGGWASVAQRLLAAPAAWQKFPILTVDPAGAWVGERMALIGDAAHAMPPFLAQGAAMAIEDAAVLADALDENPDVQLALAAYAGARRQRVTDVWWASRRTGERYHYGGAMALARNAALRCGGARIVLNRSDWIYRWRPTTRATGP